MFETLKQQHYGVIYADPPWTFVTHSAKGKGKSPEQHYGCMTIDDIAAMPVWKLAAKDCVLLMWITDPHLKLGLEIIRAWDFQYKTVGFTWAKENRKSPGFFTGMGYYTRANPEMCLLATRGKPKRIRKDVRQLIVSPRREHSRKPDEAYERIEALLPGPYCELFARTQRPGWDAWGNQTEKFKPKDVAA